MPSRSPIGALVGAGRQTRRRLWLAAIAPLALLSQVACSSLPSVTNIVTPYRVDIQQGNVVTREQAEALKSGMPRAQVRELLGSPLLTSVFHADRWDYVFTFQRLGELAQQRRVSVFFKGDVLDRVEAGDLPTEAEFVASLDARRQVNKAPVLEATQEQLKAFQAKNAPAVEPKRPAADAAAAAPVTYPPLESTR